MPEIDKKKLKGKEETAKVYTPKGQELELQTFLTKRIDALKEARKDSLVASNRSIEDIWREADREYPPHELTFDANRRKRFESDDELGLASRLVKVGEDEFWQSNAASPDFYVKVNTALSILVDQNPEAVFIASSSRYEANTKLAYNNWKNSWEISGAKQQLKNFVFNLAKYGNGFGHTYPKLVEQDKRIRTEYFKDQPDKDKYVSKRLVKYNDLCRESLNPWSVWVSEMARIGDPLSVDDWYFEKEYSWDSFQETFKDYTNHTFARKSTSIGEDNVEPVTEKTKHEDTVKIGFYENQIKDVYAMWLPEQKVVLYHSPLPNDDGKLSLWFAPWTIRDDRTIYGIGLYEILRNDSIMYDKVMNMTMDQLVLSIYKMFFYKGTDVLGENGQIVIKPGKGEQVVDPQAITFLEVPGPGQQAWAGLQFIQDKKDQNSGVTPQLSAKFSGKTLGQDLQAKEAALERMKTPLDYILDALQQEAYISLSWQKQILSAPEILRYSSPEDLASALKEAGLSDEQIQAYLQEVAQPSEQSKLLFQEETEEKQQLPTGEVDEFGEPILQEQPIMAQFANVFPEQRYSLEQDDKGELIESDESRFYRYGVDIPTERLEWMGIIRIKPQSVLVPSKELLGRRKLDMFNLIYPAVERMLATPQLIPMLLPPIKQVVKSQDEEIKDWLDEKALMQLYEASQQPTEPEQEEKVSMSVPFEMLPPDVQGQIMEKYFGVKMEQPLFVDANALGAPSTTGGMPQPQGRGGGFKPLVGRTTIGRGKTEDGAQKAMMQIR